MYFFDKVFVLNKTFKKKIVLNYNREYKPQETQYFMSVLRFYNKNSQVFIDFIANNIEYNETNNPITYKHLVSADKGKVETDEYLLKWSRGELMIYDKLGSISLIEKLIIETQVNEDYIKISLKPENDIIAKFLFSRGKFIELYRDNQGDYAIITPEQKVEKIVNFSSVGSYNIYVTEQGNKLQICSSNIKSPKYNNLVITKVSL